MYARYFCRHNFNRFPSYNSPQQLHQIRSWYHEEYSGTWDNSQDILIEMEASYQRLGTSPNNLVNWINENANQCQVTSPPQGMTTKYDQYPPPIFEDNFKYCTKNIHEGEAKWRAVLATAASHRDMAVTLMIFASLSVVIMNMSS